MKIRVSEIRVKRIRVNQGLGDGNMGCQVFKEGIQNNQHTQRKSFYFVNRHSVDSI